MTIMTKLRGEASVIIQTFIDENKFLAVKEVDNAVLQNAGKCTSH
jgi:hypothetical protein